MNPKIGKAKSIEDLAVISKILVDGCKNEIMHYIIDDGKVNVEDTLVFRTGMVKKLALGMECPECGGDVAEEEVGVYVCESCRKHYPPEMYTRKIYSVEPDGVAEFVRSSLGCRYKQNCGHGYYRLGKLFGKKVYFCVSPDEGFYNSHNENYIIIVCDTSSVPKGWPSDCCKVVPFAELFYIKENRQEIRVADIIDDLKPKISEPRFGKRLRVNERRDAWLEVLSHILTADFNHRDFRNGKLTQSAAARWFTAVHPEIKISTKTFSRDMDEFRQYDKHKDTYDKREPVIVHLLDAAANPKYTRLQRRRAAQFAVDQRIKAKELAEDNGGIPVNLPDVKFAIGVDGRSEAVITTPEDSVYGRITI